MNNFKYELLTCEIKKEDFLDAVLRLGSFLMSHGITEVELQYGWVPFIEDEEQGKDHIISLSNLEKVLKEETRHGRIDLGMTDIWLETPEPRSSFRICNDRDLHVLTDDKRFLDDVCDLWLEFVPEVYMCTVDDEGNSGPLEYRTPTSPWQKWTKE